MRSHLIGGAGCEAVEQADGELFVVLVMVHEERDLESRIAGEVAALVVLAHAGVVDNAHVVVLHPDTICRQRFARLVKRNARDAAFLVYKATQWTCVTNVTYKCQ